MRVEDMMSTPAITIAPEASLADAIRQMVAHRVSGLPIVDREGALVGILSEGDLLRRVELGTAAQHGGFLSWLVDPGRRAAEYAKANGRTVAEVMTRGVETVSPSDSAAVAVKLMEQKRIKRLPVVDGGAVVGILSRADLLRVLAQMLAPAYEDAPASDEEIRKAILAELSAQTWAPIESIRISVDRGVVSLSGFIFDERQRAAIKVAAENASGVMAVHDHLVWVEPFTGATLPSPEDEGPGRDAA